MGVGAAAQELQDAYLSAMGTVLNLPDGHVHIA